MATCTLLMTHTYTHTHTHRTLQCYIPITGHTVHGLPMYTWRELINSNHGA